MGRPTSPPEALPAAVRARRAETAETLIACVRAHGDEWWAAWDGPQWSPTDMAGGTPFRGPARLTLAASALESGFSDRRWADSRQLGEMGYRPRRSSHETVIEEAACAGDPHRARTRCLLNAEQAVRMRGTGRRHDTPLPPEEPPWAEGGRRDAVALMDRMVRRALDILARDALLPRGPQMALASTMAAVIALSDMGIAPSEAASGNGTTRELILPARGWASLVTREPDALIDCAGAAEAVAGLVSAEESREATNRTMRKARAGASQERHRGDGRETGMPRHVREEDAPAGTSDDGDYTLGGVIDETRTASAELAGGAVHAGRVGR